MKIKNNKTIWIVFGILTQIASWGALMVWVCITYGTIIAGNGIVVSFGVALVFAIWMLMRSLKETAENGYGLIRKTARSTRSLIPLVILLIAVLVINTNIAGMVGVILFGVIGNIVALPLGVISYYASPQYTEDTGTNRILERL